jgi:organic radical activating enzyme
MDEYSIITTYHCNWTCSYCIREGDGKCRPIEDVFEAAHKIPKGATVSLSGGEPGTLPEESLMELMTILTDKGCKVDICSNGQIFKYPAVVGMANSVWYHCSMDMEIDDVVIKTGDPKVEYMVVVTDNNFHNLTPFIEKHGDIQINIVPAIKGEHLKSSGNTLSFGNAIKILRLYRDRVSEENLELLLSFGDCGCDDIYI